MEGKGRLSIDKKKILRGVMEGLKYLHVNKRISK